MVSEIEKLINDLYYIEYSEDSLSLFDKCLNKISTFINENHFLKTQDYLDELYEIDEVLDKISNYKLKHSLYNHKIIQKKIVNLCRTILNENKKIFIVHGRDIGMRDKVSALLGKLKLDYVILETEHNNGSTIIEKFLRNAKDCRYAIILFSGDDKGGLNHEGAEMKIRTRQNVVLELGFFLSQVGRKNITILHDVDNNIEKPSDFDGIVYEPFDEYGAWKNKLMKELRVAKIYIDPKLADRV